MFVYKLLIYITDISNLYGYINPKYALLNKISYYYIH